MGGFPNLRGGLGKRLGVIALAPVAGFIACFPVLFLVSQTLTDQPYWVVFTVVTTGAAIAWMSAGMAVGKAYPEAGVFTFVLGAGLCWFLERGLIASASPLLGIVSVLCASIGGITIWALWPGSAVRRPVWTWGVILTVGFLPSFIAMRTPWEGRQRDVRHSGGYEGRVPLVGSDDGEEMFVWVSALPDSAQEFRDGWTIEMDSGSGFAPATLERVTSAEGSSACELRARALDQLRAWEIEDGAVPSFLANVPLPRATCEHSEIRRLRFPDR